MRDYRERKNDTERGKIYCKHFIVTLFYRFPGAKLTLSVFEHKVQKASSMIGLNF